MKCKLDVFLCPPTFTLILFGAITLMSEIASSLIYAMFARKDFDNYGIALIDSYVKNVFKK